ncbi:hypothetical protein E2562_014185 [Oryza meyeriana var. granulata]|uniref:Uncharacterized protein n=1 Tax=Oryza meyeriana var. granulata TaxID=110450 RepID=A0A6G1BKH1_9ORYZ|nr:hypothetical protein E2562_014185 [Oryza meyeriana var. granulata]
MESNRFKSFEETTAIIKVTTDIFKFVSSPPPMAPSPHDPTKCSTECPNGSSPCTMVRASYVDEEIALTVNLELGDGEDKDHAPYIVIMDLPEVMPTTCSTICPSSDVKPDLTVAAVATCPTTTCLYRHGKY